MSQSPSLPKPAIFLLALAICLSSCHRPDGKGPSSNAREMRLSSDYTEIVVYSTKIPGYWGGQIGDGERFFLYTADQSYKKGDVISVEGPFGTSPASVFDDQTRVYRADTNVNILVVWKSTKIGSAGSPGPPPKKVPE